MEKKNEKHEKLIHVLINRIDALLWNICLWPCMKMNNIPPLCILLYTYYIYTFYMCADC